MKMSHRLLPEDSGDEGDAGDEDAPVVSELREILFPHCFPSNVWVRYIQNHTPLLRAFQKRKI